MCGIGLNPQRLHTICLHSVHVLKLGGSLESIFSSILQIGHNVFGSVIFSVFSAFVSLTTILDSETFSVTFSLIFSSISFAKELDLGGSTFFKSSGLVSFFAGGSLGDCGSTASFTGFCGAVAFGGGVGCLEAGPCVLCV